MNTAPKTPLDAALENFTTKESLVPTLQIVHAVLSETWTASMLEKTEPAKTDAEIAAEARVFSRMIRSVEGRLGGVFQPHSQSKSVTYGKPPPKTQTPA